MSNNFIREKIAEFAHDQWSRWMKYLFSKCIVYEPNKVQAEAGAMIIPKWAVVRWMRQIRTPYAELSEDEKDSDRQEADKYLSLTKEQK